MRSLTAAAVLGLTLTITLAGCGDDYDSDLVDALKAQGATQEEAECFIDELGEDDAQAFADAVGEDGPPENAEEILAALEECGVAADGANAPEGEESPEETSPAPEDTSADGGSSEPAIEDVAACLEGEGLTATTDDGPPPRIDIIGSGTGAVFYYADADQAADASEQFVDAFGGGGEFITGSTGSIAYYYQNSGTEASSLEGCLN